MAVACGPKSGCTYVPRDREFTSFACARHGTLHHCSEQCSWRVPTRQGFVCPVSGRFCGAVVCDDEFHGVARVLEAAVAPPPGKRRSAADSEEGIQSRLASQIMGVLRRLFVDAQHEEDFSARVHGLATELARLRRVYGSRMHNCTIEAHVLSFVDAFRTGYVFGNATVVERDEWVARHAPSMATVERLGFGAGESATGKRALASAVASFCSGERVDDFCLDVDVDLPDHARGRRLKLDTRSSSSSSSSGTHSHPHACPCPRPPLSPVSVEDVDVLLTEFV